MHLTSKGQVTIPKKFREKFGLRQGVEIEFVEKNGFLTLDKSSRVSIFDRVYGILSKPGVQKRSTDELIEKLRGR